MAVFKDRTEAGIHLANRLERFRGKDAVVLALPRGGVPVAFQVARALSAPLEVLVVHKIGAPGNQELGIGAIAEDDVLWLDTQSSLARNLSPSDLEAELKHGLLHVSRAVSKYRGDRTPVDLRGRTAIIVDDGIATGVTAKAAARLAHQRGAERVVVAAPVGAPDASVLLGDDVDELVCLRAPQPLIAVSMGYSDFDPVSDDEVLDYLKRARDELPDPFMSRKQRVRISETLLGTYFQAEDPMGVVLVAHGAGSSGLSSRNLKLASALDRIGISTVLPDLERPGDEGLNDWVDRFIEATDWVAKKEELRGSPIGYFGGSTGAAVAFGAASRLGSSVAAIVSRGGRIDLVRDALGSVNSPSLLIVGDQDHSVLEANRSSQPFFRGTEAELAIIPGAGHLFEEEGAMDLVCVHATEWFQRWFSRRRFPAEAA